MQPDETPDTTAVDDAQEQADFGSGFSGVEGKTVEKPAKLDKPAAPDKPSPAATPRVEEKPAPEYIQITRSDWAEVRAAAAKTASYDQQLSKAFGTIGNLQKLVNGFQTQAAPPAPPAQRKVEISRAAFAEMEKDFPELAQQTRAALEAALSGLPGNAAADVDATKIESMLASYTSRREIEALEDAYPTWRQIVGAVNVTSGEQPDPNNEFRKWLGTKDAAYQNRINGSESAAVIGRAIRTFQNETKAAPAKVNGTPRDTARADRIRSAVQPRGDAGGAQAGNTENDEFEAGFRSR